MNPEKQAFLDAISRDRYDEITRKVFADWLSEHGYDEEALVQRKWTKEKQESEDWLRDFAGKIKDDYDGYDGGEVRKLTYERLMEGAQNFLDTGEAIYLNFDTPDIVYQTREEFWHHFAIVTDENTQERSRGSLFRCGC